MSREQELANKIIKHYLEHPRMVEYRDEQIKNFFLYGVLVHNPDELEELIKEIDDEQT